MSPALQAALWMSGAILSFTSMAVAGRELSGAFDTFEIMLYRSLIGLLIVCVIARAFGRSNTIYPRRLRLHGIRNMAHFIGQNLWFYALTVIPLAQVFALEFTAPVWVVLLSPLILGERLTATRMLAALIGFAGILIVARPTPETIDTGIIAAAIAAVCFAFTGMFTKKLTRTEPVLSILFWLTLFQGAFGLICAGYDLDIALPDLTNLPLVVVVGVGGLMAHFSITKALSLAPATIVMPVDFIRLPVIAVIGMLLYKEDLDWYVFLGAAVIFAGNYINIYFETRPPKQTA
ncbi:DMT family transporter [Rhodobacteraceae bacterium D3-12]|nr:DMT family transporter [Rhodobacteraceae bacterium D3-12]